MEELLSSGVDGRARVVGTSNQGNRGVDYVLSAVSFISRHSDGISVDDIVKDLGCTKHVAKRVLGELEKSSFLTYDMSTKCYRIGPEFLRIAAGVLDQKNVLRATADIVKQLVAFCGETACLNQLDRRRLLLNVLLVVESPLPLHYVVEVGSSHPLFIGASGKSILAYLSETDRNSAYFDRRCLAENWEPAVSYQELEVQLGRIRKDGYAVTFGERLVGSVGVAAPVRDQSGKVVGSLQLTIPEHRFDLDRIAHLSRAVVKYSKKLHGML